MHSCTNGEVSVAKPVSRLVQTSIITMENLSGHGGLQFLQKRVLTLLLQDDPRLGTLIPCSSCSFFPFS